ncbi:MAG: response regulator transcription factor [bacterium]
MRSQIVLYGLGLAVLAFLLEWIDYLYLAHSFALEFYISLIAVGFTALGIWVGHKATKRPDAKAYQLNHAALTALAISPREYQVLELLAEGHSNKEIARHLCVSPNTIKTHLARLFEKLDVNRRTQAINKARALRLIP